MKEYLKDTQWIYRRLSSHACNWTPVFVHPVNRFWKTDWCWKTCRLGNSNRKRRI